MIEFFITTIISIVLWAIILSIKSNFSSSNIKSLKNNSSQNTSCNDMEHKTNESICYYCGSSYSNCQYCEKCQSHKCKVCGKCRC